MQLKELNDTSLENEDVKEKFENALQVVDKIIEKGILDRKDIEILIERIEVDEEGFPEIELKYGLSRLIKYSPAQEMNRRENEIIYQTMRLIYEEERGFHFCKIFIESTYRFRISEVQEKCIASYRTYDGYGNRRAKR